MVVPFRTAAPAGLGGDGAVCPARHLGGDDAGWHGDDPIAHQHHERCEEAAERRLRGDVAVAHRRQRDDRPIDADRNAGEAVLGALDEVHCRTDDHDDHRAGEQEDEDLASSSA